IWDDDSDPDFYYCNVQGGRDAFGLNSNVFCMGAYEYQGNTGVPDHSIQDQVTVYPNPFTNTATIHVRNNPGRLQLGIYDMCGKRMKSIEHITGDKIRVERDHLIPGIYIYELRDEAGEVFTGKLVVAD
ncbi:MAG: T9SS type A sorting domain-containing protein, partial [Bacteroidales bacterium]|nr:T9SS type A sorting domain-containing protein [Bacteroidales bacterium]